MKPVALVLCFVCGLLALRPAWAATPAAMQAARAHFQAATVAFKASDFIGAVKEYKAAYAAMPEPSFLYNVAQAYRLGAQPAQALFYYRWYLRDDPGASNRAEIEAFIVRLEADVAATPAPSPSTAALLVAPAPATPRPLHKQGWFWAVVAGSVVIVAGIGVGLGLGLTSDPTPPTGLGNTKVFLLGGAR